ncbi:MAG: sodium-translocating pyrophosphatase [Phycisphaerales bacterium]|nr:sodium-translocating pyrophosphatase [Phycisphaerales bacterium]
MSGWSRPGCSTFLWFLCVGAALLWLPERGWSQAEPETVPTAPVVTTNGDIDAHAMSEELARPMIPWVWWLAPITAIVALVYARKFYLEVRAADPGDPEMIEIADAVREGAMAYLWRQYRVVAIVFVALMAILGWMAYGLGVQNEIVPFAFLTGGAFSGLCGYLGMRTATLASNRTTAAARKSLNDGLRVAFRAGAVMGLVVVGFALLDITAWFIGLYYFARALSLNDITVIMLTFGMGASTQALFARVGGGIYTKAADVGADLVGKVEAGIPEDDPRNPATIADNVGDNVGDVAGMGADLYESYAGSILATAALGVAAAAALFGHGGAGQAEAAIRFLAAPMLLAGIGILLSIAGIYLVRTEEGANMAQLMGALNRGINGSSLMIAVAGALVCWLLLGNIEVKEGEEVLYTVRWWGIWLAMVSGLFAGVIIGKATEYYTSYDYSPTKRISEQGITGPATIIIAGIAEGMKSTWAALLTIIIAIMAAFVLAGGASEFMLGLYGVGFAAVGMLATLGITLATDAYGPIADNAGGNAEMTGQRPEVRKRTDALDSLGNTTAATGKGFAIGSAALTALALLAAYIEEVRTGQLLESRAVVASEFTRPVPDEALYIGHGKFASRIGVGNEIGAFKAYMILNMDELPDKALDQMKAMKESRTRLPLGHQLGKEDGYVRLTPLPGSDAELKLVPVRQASMQQFMTFYNVTLMNPRVLCGAFAGVLLTFLFCALTMKAVGRAANRMMIECRRQFEKIRQYLRNSGKDEAFVQNPDNWPRRVDVDGQRYPNYADCVAISTAGAQREMIVPSLLAIAVPVAVGLVLGVPGVMGLLVGGLTSGFAVAIFMANAGGAWDNAKKLIETFGKLTAVEVINDPAVQERLPQNIRAELVSRAKQAVAAGFPETIIYGKGSEVHKAGVVGDTVGDPFKDTSGPSLNILIKLMSMVSVVFAGLIVKYAPQIGEWLQLG